MPSFSRILTIGDSVLWGQGLLPEHKIDRLVWAQVGNGSEIQNLAHSGAIIGATGGSGSSAADGEVPASYPTILQQCDSFSDSPESIDLILLNGSINDVGVTRILNPTIQSADLSDRIRLHCYFDVKILLDAVLKKFSNARVLLGGYFPILSTRSEPLRIPGYASMHGIGQMPFLDVDFGPNKIVSACLQFWKESDSYLAQAAREMGSARLTFVPSPFTEANSVFADTPLLYGITSLFGAQDEVSANRHDACLVQYPPIGDIMAREQCYRASAGHPNVAGAAAIAEAMIEALR